MLELLTNVVLFWLVMPALIIGVGKMALRFAAEKSADGLVSQRRVSRFRMLRAENHGE